MPVYRLPDTGTAFPDPRAADAGGLLAVGGDLSPLRLMAAYGAGVFPCYGPDSPRLWWAPDPRCILLPGEFRLPRSLAAVLRKGLFTCTFDRDFAGVIRGCAGPRPGLGGIWLLPEMIEAYTALHRLGLAHSVEAWDGAELAGGLYGVALGGAFFGESMFYRKSNASRAALACLVAELKRAGFTLIDCQQTTPHMLRFGARPVPRGEFMDMLDRALALRLPRGSWKEGVPCVTRE